MSLQASDYASGYPSPWYPGTIVPTVCGVIGMGPRGSYLLLPVSPGGLIDQARAQPFETDPGDGTTPNDGWALFSGTSAAAPQVAGVAALMLGANPGLSPLEVRDALARTAIDVTGGVGNNPFRNRARPGPDEATGAGLVNAWAAVRAVL